MEEKQENHFLMKNTRLQAISRRASPILSDLGSPPHMESPPELPPPYTLVIGSLFKSLTY